jgi:hypothetical protein
MYCVVRYTLDGKFDGVISGMGRNKGTWDSTHGRRTAQRHAACCRKEDPNHLYKVEPTV